MKIVHIKQKLEEIGITPDNVVLGDFDAIGEFTAKKQRSPDEPNYKKFGAFFRPNYERGILVYNLIRQHNLTSFLEIGFGRGYATFCAAKAFHDAGVKGKIVTIDPNFDQKFIEALHNVFPKEWFDMVTFAKGTSDVVLPKITDRFDFVYVDGDHSYEGTKKDWLGVKDKFTSLCLFDDYHMPSKNEPGIQCARAIDEIDWKAAGCKEPELIKLDRRMFLDERGVSDDDLDYGQVLLTKEGVSLPNDW